MGLTGSLASLPQEGNLISACKNMAAKINPRNKNAMDANEEKYWIFQLTLASGM